jgi:hypothetical protein
MKVNTALSFLCLGAGLWLTQDEKWQRSRRICGFFIIIIAGLTLAEYAFYTSFGIDQLLFRDTRTPSLSAYPGRMAVATATCFILLGLAVALLGTKKAVALRRSLVAVCVAHLTRSSVRLLVWSPVTLLDYRLFHSRGAYCGWFLCSLFSLLSCSTRPRDSVHRCE